MDVIEKIYNLIGSFVCHQLPARTISAGGIPFPMCARDTGIYLGIFIALVYILARRRFKSDMPPKIPLTIVLCLFMLCMALDGVSSYLGFRETDNTIRLLTGAFFGVSIPFFMIPAANYRVDGVNNRFILYSWKEIPILSGIILLVCGIILKTGIIPWLLISTVIVFSFVFIIGRIAYTIITRTGIKKYKHVFLLMTCSVILVLLLLLFVSNFLLQPLKNQLLAG